MQLDFSGQRVIITGGTRGIGAGLAKAYLQAGANVIATYVHNHEAAERFKDEHKIYGEQLEVRSFDVSDSLAVSEFFKEIESEGKEFQVLVNNSGIRRDCLSAQMTEEQFADVIGVNLKGAFLMSQKAILHFLPQRYGRILTISSIGSKMGLPGQANYAASKAGEIAMSSSIAKEVAKKNITVNCLLPGFIETELIADLEAEQAKSYRQQVPMKKFGTPEDVASAALFLTSLQASYITGATLEVSGGLGV